MCEEMLDWTRNFCHAADLVGVGAEEQEVEGNGGDEVDDEPAAEVVDGDLGGRADHLVVLAHVRRPEVDEDVNDEHDVDEQVDDDDGVVRVVPPRVGVARLVEKEGRDVGREDGRVDDEDEDDPVPQGLEGRVVQDGPLVDPRGLQLVLRHHLGAQGEHLAEKSKQK